MGSADMIRVTLSAGHRGGETVDWPAEDHREGAERAVGKLVYRLYQTEQPEQPETPDDPAQPMRPAMAVYVGRTDG